MTGSEPAAPDLRSSLLRHLGVAAGVIALVAVAFWAIGAVGDDEASLVVADAPDDAEDAAEEPAGDPAPEEDDAESDPSASDEGQGEDAADDPSEPEDPVDEPVDDGAEGEADEADEELDVAEEEPEPDPDPEPEVDRIDPASITVQVLDGYRADGGAAARTVAASLRDGGYRVVAENPALAYDVTTVLFTAGHEAAARQIAADLGAPEVREKPANLSDQVAVHVVVGADRA